MLPRRRWARRCAAALAALVVLAVAVPPTVRAAEGRSEDPADYVNFRDATRPPTCPVDLDQPLGAPPTCVRSSFTYAPLGETWSLTGPTSARAGETIQVTYTYPAAPPPPPLADGTALRSGRTGDPIECPLIADGRCASEVYENEPGPRELRGPWLAPDGASEAPCVATSATSSTCTVKVGEPWIAERGWYRLFVNAQTVSCLSFTGTPPDVRCGAFVRGPDSPVQLSLLIEVTGNRVGPTASFDAAAEGASGTWRFTDTSTGTCPGTTWSWRFGDGATSTLASPTHTYAEPGTYDVELTVRSANGVESTTTRRIEVAAPELTVAVSFPPNGDRPPIGTTATATVTVSAGPGAGSLLDLRFPDGVIVADQPAAVDLTSAPVVAAFALAPSTTRQFSVPVRSTRAERVRLTTTVQGLDSAGRTVRATASTGFGPTPLEVTVTVDRPTIELDNEPTPPFSIVAQDVVVTARVRNATGSPVRDVVVDDRPTLKTSDGTVLVPFPVEVIGPARPAATIGDLAVGQEAVVTYTLRVSGAVPARVEVLALGAGGGETVRGLGIGGFTAEPTHLLVFDAFRPGGEDGEIPAGSAFEVFGTVSNRSASTTFVLDPLSARTSEGLTFREERPLSEPFSGDVTAADCTGKPPVRIRPGETYRFHARGQTVALEPGASPFQANLSFGVTDVEADAVRFGPGGAEVLEPLAASRVFRSQRSGLISARVVAPERRPSSNPNDLILGFSDGFLDRSYIAELTRSLNGLRGSVAASLHAMDLFQTVWGQMSLAERQSAIRFTAENLARRTGDAARNGPALLDGVNEGLNRIEQWWAQTDMAEAGYRIGGLTKVVVGDITLGVATDALVCRVLTTSASYRGARLAEQVLEEDAAAVAAGGLRVDKGLQGVPAGATATDALLAARLGASPVEIAAIEQAAEKHGVLILVRSRAAAALDYIAKGLGVPKMFAMKPKGFNDLDRLLFGITELGADGKPLVQDAFTVIQKGSRFADESEVRALAAANGLDGPQTDVLVKRWKTRRDEWASYGEKLLKWAEPQDGLDHGFIPVEISVQDNVVGLITGNRPLAVERKPFRMDLVLDKDGVQTYVPKVRTDDGRWVPIVGDIDLVGIVDANTMAIPSAGRLEAVLRDLVDSPARIQHADTLQWLHAKTAVNLPRAHLPGGEPMLAIGPGGQRRMAYFDPRRSLGTDARLEQGAKLIFLGGAPRWPLPLATTAATVTAGGAVELDEERTFIPPKLFDVQVTWDRSSGSFVRQRIDGRYERWTPSTGWQPIPRPTAPPSARSGGTAAAEGLTTAPVTALVVSTPVGSTTSTTMGADVVGAPSSAWFQPGDVVVLSPGTEREERAVLAGTAPMRFAQPLRFEHAAGELVGLQRAAPEPPPTTTTTPPTSTTSSPSPPTSPPGDPAGVDGGAPTDAGELARTGGSPLRQVALGAALLLAGGAILVVRRPRRPAER